MEADHVSQQVVEVHQSHLRAPGIDLGRRVHGNGPISSQAVKQAHYPCRVLGIASKGSQLFRQPIAGISVILQAVKLDQLGRQAFNHPPGVEDHFVVFTLLVKVNHLVDIPAEILEQVAALNE